MKKLTIRMVVVDMEVSFFADTGTFGEAAQKIENIFEFLTENGIEFSEILPPEQHRHGPDGQHVHTHQYQNS